MLGKWLALVAALALGFSAHAVTRGDDKATISADNQKKLDEWKVELAKWASDPVVVNAVLEQNKIGPIPGMTEDKWKALKPRAAEVKAFETCPAGEFLKKKVGESEGRVSEAFLNAEQGEKVAFTSKTSSYCHKGKGKFDKPFDSKKPWQGEPEFDESTQTQSVQIAVPVLEKRKEGGNELEVAIGVLIVGIELSKL